MERMTHKELILWLADDFHDWIDGDDPVQDYKILDGHRIWVDFESGQSFVITVAEVYQ